MKKRFIAAVVSAVVCAGLVVGLFVERVPAGHVGVVYSSQGVEDEVLSHGWKIISPFKSIKNFPISQQQLVLSNNPGDYNAEKHQDWSIAAPANGGMVTINMTVNYNFMQERVVDLYKRFNGMDGDTLVDNMVQNSIIAYIKEVTPRFSVMDIYSDKRAEVSAAITEYLNSKLENEYGIHIDSALIIDVQLNATLMEKIQAKEQAKQDAEKAELDKQTAIAQAETEKVIAETEAQVAIIKANAEAEMKLIEANAEAEANRTVSTSITQQLIEMKIAEARMKHGWVEVTGSDVMVSK